MLTFYTHICKIEIKTYLILKLCKLNQFKLFQKILIFITKINFCYYFENNFKMSGRCSNRKCKVCKIIGNNSGRISNLKQNTSRTKLNLK